MKIPQKAKVVIIGGGIGGCSVAYHLAKLGWSDVVLLERRHLTCGTTWHAAGLVTQFKYSENMTRLAKYCTELYSEIEAETGQATGFRRNGSITLATHAERLEEVLRAADACTSFGVEAEVCTPDRLGELWPGLNTVDLLGGVFIPRDGQCNPVDTAMALAKGARALGVSIFENVMVTAISRAAGRVNGVSTDHGDIAAEYVVNCGGMWGREIGRMAGVDVPLHACEHFYVVTEAIAGLAKSLPIVRDVDSHAYCKEDAGKLLVGGFEPNPKAWGAEGIPDDFCFDEIAPDFDHMAPTLELASRRFPILAKTGIRTFFNGPESFTPDGQHLVGESPDLKNFFVAAGFNSSGIGQGAGIGKVLAEWIVHGRPSMDLWEIDIARVQPFQTTESYLRERAVATLGKVYAMHWPNYHHQSARDIRRSALHDALTRHGCLFEEVAGWERPCWFAGAGAIPEEHNTYRKAKWFENVAAEHMAVRNKVGILDMSAYAKFLVQGRDAASYLQKICTANIDVEPGRVVYTLVLNSSGGIEADWTVFRLGENAFQIVTIAAASRKHRMWLERHIAADEFVTVTDVTSGQAVIGLMGPSSRSLLQDLSDASLDNRDFPFGTTRIITIGQRPVRAVRLCFAGELGWELYVPTEFAPSLFDEIVEAGCAHDARLIGMMALETCRMERGFREWGHDITPDDTPLEAGLGSTLSWKKDIAFIGRDAICRQREENRIGRRLIHFALHDPEPLLYHNEPIWQDDKLVGYTSSCAYGHLLGRSLAMGYVHAAEGATAEAFVAGRFEIAVAGVRQTADASLVPFYDPAGERIRS